MIEQSELNEIDLSIPPVKQTRWDTAPLTTGLSTNGSTAPQTDPNGSAPSGSASDSNGADPDPDEKKERGGIFLAAVVGLLLPVIFIAAYALSDTDDSTDLEQGIAASTSTGLESLGIADADENGTPQLNEGLTPTTAGAESSSANANTNANTTDVSEEPTGGSVEVEVAGTTSIAEVSATGTGASAATADENIETTSEVVTDTSGSATTPTTTSAPSTAAPPTRARPSDPASAPTTPPTTASPPTTITPTTIGSPPATVAIEVPLGPRLSERIDIGQLGDTFVRVRFAAGSTTSYRVVVLGEGRVVATRTGTAVGGQTVNVSVDGLTPGTDYNIQVSLNGPPAFTSSPVSFRTSGGAPEPIVEQVQLLNLRIVETGSTRFELNYESNICANGSFTIRERGNGSVVGSNAGQASGCTTRHLAIPGFWTPALKPNTTYIITVAVEAGGAGLGNGNTATQSMSVTTN